LLSRAPLKSKICACEIFNSSVQVPDSAQGEEKENFRLASRKSKGARRREEEDQFKLIAELNEVEQAEWQNVPEEELPGMREAWLASKRSVRSDEVDRQRREFDRLGQENFNLKQQQKEDDLGCLICYNAFNQRSKKKEECKACGKKICSGCVKKLRDPDDNWLRCPFCKRRFK
jgi:hypothetical protein